MVSAPALIARLYAASASATLGVQESREHLAFNG